MPSSIAYSFFVETALKSTAVLGAAWLAALLMRGRSAAAGHLVWSVAFTALLALPFLSMALPAWRVPVAVPHLPPGLVFQASAHGSIQDPAWEARRYAMGAPLLKSASWLPDWRMLLMIVWAAGTAISFGQMLIGWNAIARLRRTASPFTLPGFAALAKVLNIQDEVDLLETARGSMPITYGLLRPAIFMPADAAEWTAERRQVVLLHELAHVRRCDAATHLLARTVLGLYWWNPLAWAAWRELLKARERAADDLVLGAGTCASEYAGHLLAIARSMQSTVALGCVALAVARRSQLEGRLSAILDSSRDRKTPRRVSAIAAALAAIGIMAPVAALQARSDTAPAELGSQVSESSAAASFLKQGDEARDQRKYDQAKALYGKALDASGNGPVTATALIHLGTVELATKNFEEAIADFERAQAGDALKAADARMWMAIVRERQNNLEAADGLYQSALAAEDPNSAGAAAILELYAQLLQRQGRTEEAGATRKQADSIRKEQAEQAQSTLRSSSSDVYRVGGDVTAPSLVSKVEPSYTEEARLAKYQGTIMLSVEIGADGSARDIKVLRALAFGLDEKAIEAVSRWRFKPGTKDGQPVTVAATIEVNFRLL